MTNNYTALMQSGSAYYKARKEEGETVTDRRSPFVISYFLFFIFYFLFEKKAGGL
jgi:hypothetical protein